MDRLDAMATFVRVVETGSFSAVARERGVAQPTVSKQVAALERHLGAQLLRRTSRRVGPTEAGAEFYAAAKRLIANLEEAEQRAGRGQSAPAGHLRASVPAAFGRLRIVPLLPAFLARHPGITLDLEVTDRFADLVGEGLDVAVRIAELADSGLVARRIAASPRALVATPAFLARHGEPAGPDDIARFPCVVFTFRGAPNPWPFRTTSGELVLVRPEGPVRSNDAETARAAVLAGLGLAQAPAWLFAAELASGEVRALLPRHAPAATPVHAVHPGPGQPPAKVRAFIDHLARAFASDPTLGAA